MTYPPQGGHSGWGPTGAAGQDHASAQPGYAAQPGYQPAGGYPAAGGGAWTADGQWSAEAARTTPWPPSNVGWAVASIIFFWPLAFIAMTRALEVYPLWAAGRHAEAEAASDSAKKLGIIALVIAIVAWVLFIGVYAVFAVIMAEAIASGGYY